jgi:hypothetical protein
MGRFQESMRKISLILTLVLMAAIPSRAQLWSGVIDPKRAVDWTTAGVTGGIPTRTTICQTLNPGATAAQIQTAINNCPSGQVVFLNAGNYTLNNGLTMKSNVTLRGAGANQTILTFSGHTSDYWGPMDVLFQGNYVSSGYGSAPGMGGAPSTNNKTWVGTNGVTGTYTKGATVLNLGTAPTGSPNLQVGDMLQLYQSDDSGITSGLFICSSTSANCSLEGSGYTDGTGEQQYVRVTNISGTQVTVTPGIFMDNWVTAKNPHAYWFGGDIRMAGLEDLRVNTDSGLWGGIEFWQASDCWVTGVAFHSGTGSGSIRTGIRLIQTRNITVANNWIDPMNGGAYSSTTSYGVETMVSSAFLIQNNIFYKVESPVLFSTGTTGGVLAYNYNYQATVPETGILSHEVGTLMNLWEGNEVTHLRTDDFHGGANLITLFRNVSTGSGEAAVNIDSNSRYYNIIGNVLGDTSPANYEAFAPNSCGTCTRYDSNIYRVGYPGAGSCSSYSDGGGGNVAYDTVAPGTLMRWGNYDTKNGAARFVGSEVPTGLSDYPNAVPANNTLPPSFYLSSKPSWWPSGKPWPLIGPDVTGGNISGFAGHAYTTPAHDCFTSISGNVANFNATACYGGGTSVQQPVPPSGLQAVVQTTSP